jgi:non-heme chloroperoxidase
MTARGRAVVVGLWGALGWACRGAPAPVPWRDPSPHQVSFVTVAPGVRLEVLDWGGAGPPLVFISGLQDVAHGFDDFAPQFTDHFRVLAITRRGYGASSQTPQGYDVGTRLQDLHAALDSLHFRNVILVGHSIAGDELTAFAGAYPDHVSKLIYFDAAYDHSEIGELIQGYPEPPPMLAADSASPAAVQAYTQRVFGERIPEAQIRAIGVFDATGKLVRNVTPDSIDAEVIRGAGHPDYSRVRAPILALYSVVDSAPQLFPTWASMSDSVRAQARAFTVRIQAWSKPARARLGARSHTTVIELHGANHYLFFSNQEEVVAAMRAFLDGTPGR